MSERFEPVILALDHPVVVAALESAAPEGRVVVLDSVEAMATYASAKPAALIVLPDTVESEAVGTLRRRQEEGALHGQLLRLSPDGSAVDPGSLDPWRGPDAPPPPLADDLPEIVSTLCEFAKVGELTGLVGESTATMSVLRLISRIAQTDVPVLIQGPSGTGKELVARGIHRASARALQPFMAVNTPGLSESLIESELFGHERGAFTGASSRKEGVFEAAGEGTIFLDEIGDLSRSLQAKLLRVLEQHEFQRVGGTQTIRVRARVLAATNVDLERAVTEGKVREDLYFRLKVVTVELPPLRERREDIPPLLRHYIHEVCRERRTDFHGFTDEAMAFLQEYAWPGNVRELRNLVEQVVFLHPKQKVDVARLEQIFQERHRDTRHLPAPTGRTPEQAEREMIFKSLQALSEAVTGLRDDLDELGGRSLGTDVPWRIRADSAARGPDAGDPLKGTIAVPLGVPLEEVELRLVEETMRRLSGDKQETARVLGIGLRTLYRRLSRLQELRGGWEPGTGDES